LAFALAYHSVQWRVSVLEAEASVPFDLARADEVYRVVRLPDPGYIALVNGTAILSLATLLGVLAMGVWITTVKKRAV
ncbi:MAG: hypothetical protein ACRDIB_10505, partial [Ardenticatenaceae bacterium]